MTIMFLKTTYILYPVVFFFKLACIVPHWWAKASPFFFHSCLLWPNSVSQFYKY